MRSQESTIKDFFQEARVAALLLPDGWFGGRPMENSHVLSFALQRPKRLIMELDDQLLLVFSPGVDASETTTDLAMRNGTRTLILSGFRQLVFEYLEYGSDEPAVRYFREGRVSLVAPE